MPATNIAAPITGIGPYFLNNFPGNTVLIASEKAAIKPQKQASGDKASWSNLPPVAKMKVHTTATTIEIASILRGHILLLNEEYIIIRVVLVKSF